MGACNSSNLQLIRNQDLIIIELREKLDSANETVEQFKHHMNTPKGQEELEILRQKIIYQRELTELKNVLELQEEVNKIKTDLNIDPSIVLTDIQTEISLLHRKLDEIKQLKALKEEVNSPPPHASLLSIPPNPKNKTDQTYCGWQIKALKEDSFHISSAGIKVLCGGLYQIYVGMNGFGYHSSSRCAIVINNVEVSYLLCLVRVRAITDLL